MNQVQYRPALRSDINDIKELSDKMLANTGLGLATVAKITALVTSPRTLFMLAFVDDKLVGFTLGILHENVFNDVLRVSDIGVFVLPKYRELDIGRHLISLLEQWAKENKAQQLWLGQTTGEQVTAIAEYYSKLGFKICGFNAVKEL